MLVEARCGGQVRNRYPPNHAIWLTVTPRCDVDGIPSKYQNRNPVRVPNPANPVIGNRTVRVFCVLDLDLVAPQSRVSQSVRYFTVPPRGSHPFAGSPSGSAAPGLYYFDPKG